MRSWVPIITCDVGMQAQTAKSSTSKITNQPPASGQEAKGAGRQEATAKVQGPNPVRVSVQPMAISPRGGAKAVSLEADSGKSDKKPTGETVQKGKSLRDLGQEAQKDARSEQELALRILPMDIGPEHPAEKSPSGDKGSVDSDEEAQEPPVQVDRDDEEGEVECDNPALNEQAKKLTLKEKQAASAAVAKDKKSERPRIPKKSTSQGGGSSSSSTTSSSSSSKGGPSSSGSSASSPSSSSAVSSQSSKVRKVSIRDVARTRPGLRDLVEAPQKEAPEPAPQVRDPEENEVEAKKCLFHKCEQRETADIAVRLMNTLDHLGFEHAKAQGEGKSSQST